jgi:hypothetical protein
MGPVESITGNAEVVTLVILGQTFEIAVADSGGFTVGDFAVAAAHPVSGVTVYHVGSPYIPGLSKVQLKAPVAAVNLAVGTAVLGITTVDYTALLSVDPNAAPEVGESFVAAGVQPVARGAVVAGPRGRGTVGCSALDGRM